MKANYELETNTYLSECNSKDVISFGSRGLFYIHKLLDLVQAAFDHTITNVITNSIVQKMERKCNARVWFDDGEKCEILKAGSSGWQTGRLKLKVKLSLEFIPDEIEDVQSPLDDVRQEINQHNS